MRERLGSSNTGAAGRLAGSGRAASPLRNAGSRLLAPLRSLRLAIRRALLRVLR